MISRFEGDDNKEALVRAIEQQKIVQNKKQVAQKLAAAAKLSQLEAGGVLITRNAPETDIYLILAGQVSIAVNGRELALRGPHEHVGEMAMLDISAPRCATVTAIKQAVVAKISEKDFTPIADKHPYLWRNIAIELGARLRERAKFAKAPNPRPVLFVGSAAEDLTIARAIQNHFDHDPCITTVWTDGVFRASRVPIESLAVAVQNSDFAVLVFAPNDKVYSRNEESDAPRDNVTFELGLFIGSLLRERTFIVKPRGIDIKMPTDLLGLQPLEYDPKGPPNTFPSRIASVCNAIRDEINRLGPK